MAITAKQIAVNLDTNEKNCTLASNLQQGTADTTQIVVTVTPPPNTNDLRAIATKSNVII